MLCISLRLTRSWLRTAILQSRGIMEGKCVCVGRREGGFVHISFVCLCLNSLYPGGMQKIICLFCLHCLSCKKQTSFSLFLSFLPTLSCLSHHSRLTLHFHPSPPLYLPSSFFFSPPLLSPSSTLTWTGMMDALNMSCEARGRALSL